MGYYGGNRDEWDEFARRTLGGTFFHLIGWKEVLERTFGFRSHYLLARRGGTVAGILPLFEIRAPFMPRCLLSLPFAVEGGVCTTDSAAQTALDAAALALGPARHARYLELRDGREGAGFRIREGHYYRFRRELADTDVANFAALPSKRRNMVRRAQRQGLTSRVGPDQLPVFCDLYAHTARRFGTPVFPGRYFRALLERFPEEAAVLTVWRGGVAMAGALILFFGTSACPYYVGSRREFFRYGVSDFLYWEVMRHMCAHGVRMFDFGRSKLGTGAFTFKKLWGFEPEPLRYRIHLWNGTDLPNRSTNDAAVAPLRRAWQHLPVRLTQLLGPFFLARYGPYYT